jgi:four helix bundle protein
MLHSNFRTYQLSLQLYRSLKDKKLPAALKDQILRASSSVCLNLSEGSAKPTVRDRQRFYAIAFGSLREVQTLIELEPESLGAAAALADQTAAHLFKLTRS